MQANNNINAQRGGTVLGVVVGVLVGLGVALAVAVYVMKVPTPFNNKSASRSPAQDAAESKKNKDWDPNAALSGKPAAKPADTEVKAPTAVQAAPDKPSQPSATTASATSTTATTPAATAPAGDGAVEFYVQVGAFRSDADAQALRGKLALSNFEGKVVEREQAGQKVFRVRVGPFASQAAGDKAKASLDAAGFDTMVMRTQR